LIKGEEKTMLDWKRIEKRAVTVGDLIKLAGELCDDKDGSNPEYERALTELICDAAGLPMELKAEVGHRMGLKCSVE
jgi:hypothetical protein